MLLHAHLVRVPPSPEFGRGVGGEGTSRLRHSLLLCFLALALTACGGKSPSGATFTNPVYSHDFPDPSVLQVGKTYYAYATNAGPYHIPVMRSHDLVHWSRPRESMPAWARWLNGNIWAPSVIRRSDGRFVMYYAGSDARYSRQCIGVAVSPGPTGPFRDTERTPLICPLRLGGAIDPEVLRDGSRLYLYWKNDGNCCSMLDHIFAQRLSPDGLHLTSRPVSLAVNDQRWEADIVEGPTMWKHAGHYVLFYSGGYYGTAKYSVGYSTCAGPLGPCKDYPGNPILRSRCNAAGPGGETVAEDGAHQTWILYHAWLVGHVNTDTPGRVLWLDRLDWKSGRPVVDGPRCDAQPAPVEP